MASLVMWVDWVFSPPAICGSVAKRFSVYPQSEIRVERMKIDFDDYASSNSLNSHIQNIHSSKFVPIYAF